MSEQPTTNSTKTTNAPAIGGFLYVVAVLLVLACLGGLFNIYNGLSGTGEMAAALLGIPKSLMMAQTLVAAVSLALYGYATYLFFKKVKKFPQSYILANAFTAVAALAIGVWQYLTMPLLGFVSLLFSLVFGVGIPVALIYYTKRSQRVRETFIL